MPRLMEQQAMYKPESGDEDEWEDMHDFRGGTRLLTSRAASPAGSLPSRKRRNAQKAVYVSATPRKQYIIPSTPRQQARPLKATLDREHLEDAVSSGFLFSLKYIIDVVGRAIRLLRIPLSILLCIWLLAVVLGRLSHSIRMVFYPLCIIPGISSSPLCSWPTHGDEHAAKWADYPKLVDVQSTTFEQLLDESIGGSSLALEIKKAEIATSDLTTLVRVSDLTSRELLADSLSEFVEDARKTGRGMQKLSAKVGGAVDSVLAVNDYALHAIEAASSKAETSLISSLWPFSSPPSNEVITGTFMEAMDVLSTSMERVIVEAQVSLANLDKLEQHLTTLHEIITREDSSISSAKSELLSDLWTRLGGNRRKIRGFDNHLGLLQNVGGYRKRALAHVVAALQTLQSMSADMEDLRERVAAPQLIGEKVSAEVHMRSIKTGLERLRDMRVRAKEREEEAVRRVLGID